MACKGHNREAGQLCLWCRSALHTPGYHLLAAFTAAADVGGVAHIRGACHIQPMSVPLQSVLQ